MSSKKLSRSVHEPEAFQGRVDYAAQCMLRGTNTRHRDTCFEMWDGDLVVAALVRRCNKNTKLKDAVIKSFGGTFPQSWIEAAAKYAHLPRNKLADEARAVRAKAKASCEQYWKELEAKEPGTAPVYVDQPAQGTLPV